MGPTEPAGLARCCDLARCGWCWPTTTRSGARRARRPRRATSTWSARRATPTRRSTVIRRTKPDLVVCDLHMPDGGGIKVARTCGEQTRIVMLTVSEAERDLLDAVAAGAVGYLVKSTPPDELRQRAVAGRARRAGVLARARRARCSASSGAWRRPSGPVQPLSDREREVLQYVARGHTYKEIGEQLFIAEKTVENHVRNILGKLHLNRKQELIRYALEHGID